MPPAFGIQITFPRKGQAIAAVSLIDDRVEEALEKNIDEIMEVVFKESQVQVPVGETGNLKASGERNDAETKNHKIKASITYGGGANDVKYAVVQHETPPLGVGGEGGMHFSHSPPTKWKYLEDPARAQKKNFKKALRAAGTQGINMAMAGAGYRKILNVWR